MYNTD